MNKYDVDNLLNQIFLDVGAGVGVTKEERAMNDARYVGTC